MSTTKSRPPMIDQHGVEHRHGCPLPGWIDERTALRGWYLATCGGCGCVRLIRAGGAR